MPVYILLFKGFSWRTLPHGPPLPRIKQGFSRDMQHGALWRSNEKIKQSLQKVFLFCMVHHAERDRNMQLAVWQQFVTWRRNIQWCDQRTAQHLKESSSELFSTHLLFSLSLSPFPVSSLSSFLAPFLISSFPFLLISPILSHLPCVHSVKPLFYIFSSLLRANPNMGTQLQRLEPQCCRKNRSNNKHRNILLNSNMFLNI